MGYLQRPLKKKQAMQQGQSHPLGIPYILYISSQHDIFWRDEQDENNQSFWTSTKMNIKCTMAWKHIYGTLDVIIPSTRFNHATSAFAWPLWSSLYIRTCSARFEYIKCTSTIDPQLFVLYIHHLSTSTYHLTHISGHIILIRIFH